MAGSGGSKDPKERSTLVGDDVPPAVKEARARAEQGGRLASGGPPPPAAPTPGGAPAPTGPSAQSTVMMNAQTAPPPRQQVVPTMMRQRPADLPPMVVTGGGSSWGRWIGGPILALIVATCTAALAGAIMPAPSKNGRPARGLFGSSRNIGKVKVQSDPPGASLWINGRPHPHFTPTVIEGEIGSTVQLELRLDGYLSREEAVFVSAGEHPFNLKMRRIGEDDPPVDPPPVEPALPPEKKKSSPRTERPVTVPTIPDEPEATGKGSISVFVRPWAIVFIDGTRLRQTPIDKFELAAGNHTIELVNETRNRREKIPLVVEPGKNQELRYDWDK